MKKEYPAYKKGELERIFSNLHPKEKATINDFISYCGIGAGERKLKDIKRSIIQFRDIIQKSFDKLELEDIRGYLSVLNKSDREKYTKNGIKVYLKRFLKWKFKDWSKRFDDLKDIKLHQAFNEKKINEGTLLTREQIEKIMNKEKNLSKKTFFITLYESGLRPNELASSKWKDINFNVDGELSELHIYATKTSKARTIFVRDATFWLKKLKEYSQSEFIFPSAMNRNEPISRSTSWYWVQEMGKAIGLKIYPYLLRHTRATELYKSVPTKIAQKFMGHGKDMSDLYSHLSSSDLKESLLKSVYMFDKLTPEKKHGLEKEVEMLKERFKEIEKKRKSSDEVIDGLTKNPKTLRMIAQAIAKLGLVGKVRNL